MKRLSSKLLVGEDRLVQSRVYAQTYVFHSSLHRALRSRSSEISHCIVDRSSIPSFFTEERIKVESLINTIPVTRRLDVSTDLSGWVGNYHETMTTLALDDVMIETKEIISKDILKYCISSGKTIKPNRLEDVLRQNFGEFDNNLVMSIFSNEVTNINKIVSSNYHDLSVGGPLKTHEVRDKPLVFEKYPDLLVVPPRQRPFTMNYTADFGYIGSGRPTFNLNRPLDVKDLRFIIHPKRYQTILAADLKAPMYIARESLFNGLALGIPNGKYNRLIINVGHFQLFNKDNSLTVEELQSELHKRGLSFDRIDFVNPNESDIFHSRNREEHARFIQPFLEHLERSGRLTTGTIRDCINSDFDAHRFYFRDIESLQLKYFSYTYASAIGIKNDFEAAICKSLNKLEALDIGD